MAQTKQLPRDAWQDYFARITRERLSNEEPASATIEVMSTTLGDQFEVSAVRLLGLAYDPKSNALEVELEDIEHLIFHPKEIWVLEGEPGFLATLEIVRQDGLKEIIYVRKSGSLVPTDRRKSNRDAPRV